MPVAREWMVAESRALPRRWRRFGLIVTILLLVAQLSGSAQLPFCSSERPYLAAADPLVRDLRFSVLTRAATPEDMPPRRVMPADMHALTRRLSSVAGVTVYLSASQGFSCLLVDGTARIYDSSTTCRLNSTIANYGLWTTVSSDGPLDPLLIVAIPDGSSLIPPTPGALSEATSFAVFRRDDVRPISLQTVSKALISLDEAPVMFDSDGHVHRSPRPLCR